MYSKTFYSYKLDKKIVKIIVYDKSLTLTKHVVGKIIYIYKGTLLRRLFVSTNAIGFKIGEFAFTRKPFHFTLRVRKKK